VVYKLPEDGTDVPVHNTEAYRDSTDVPVHNTEAYRDSTDKAQQPTALPCANRTVADIHETPYS